MIYLSIWIWLHWEETLYLHICKCQLCHHVKHTQKWTTGLRIHALDPRREHVLDFHFWQDFFLNWVSKRSKILEIFRLRQATQYTFLTIKLLSPLVHCWKSSPNPTEDQKSPKIFACGARQLSILSSQFNCSRHWYVAGKVLQIRLKIKNLQKKLQAAGTAQDISNHFTDGS